MVYFVLASSLHLTISWIDFDPDFKKSINRCDSLRHIGSDSGGANSKNELSERRLFIMAIVRVIGLDDNDYPWWDVQALLV